MEATPKANHGVHWHPAKDLMRRAAYDGCCEEYLAMLGDGDSLDCDSIAGRVTLGLLDVIGDPEGSEILDAGCGEGYVSRLLARREAQGLQIFSTKRLS